MLLPLQNTILEKIATGEPLADIIATLCRNVEAMAPGVVCSVLEVDQEGRLHPLAAPSLPDYYCQALDGLAIGPAVGSCGTAAYTCTPVIVTDIENDPLWAACKSLPLLLGLLACWSTPIISHGRVIGTFAFYFREKRGPQKRECAIIDACVHLTAIALEREVRVRERHRLAYTDALTGLANRAAFNIAMNGLAAAGGDGWGLLLIDLDNLKLVNDTFGHAGGDDLIRIAAERIASASRPWSAYRLGGDEFAVIIGPDAEVDLAHVAEAIRIDMQAPAQCSGHVMHPSATIGGAKALNGANPDVVRQHADHALYHAKERRRGGFIAHIDGLGAAITRRLDVLRNVGAALTQDRIEPHYQPIFDLASRGVVGFEAQRRIRTEGQVEALHIDFEEAVKDAGIASALTSAMMEKVAVDLRRFRELGAKDIKIGFNVTDRDFRNGNLRERLPAAFAQAGAPLANLVIEVSEALYHGQGDHVISEEIAWLRRQGVLVALDHFGSGVGSLTHLIGRPVDVIKLDRCLTSADHPESGVIVEGLVDIARRLDIMLIANDLETEEQIRNCQRAGCLHGQGRGHSDALPFSEAAGLLLRDEALRQGQRRRLA